MTTTLTLTQNAQTINANSFPQPLGAGIDTSTLQAALYRYQLSTTTMLLWPMSFTATLTALVGGSATFVVEIIKDPDLIAAVTNGAMPATLMPTNYPPFAPIGTAAYLELARRTLATNGTYTFDLDLGVLTQVIGSQQFGNSWNGSIMLWLLQFGGTSGHWAAPTLTVGSLVDYPNRDTGRSGAPTGSRVSRCPVTGLAISRQQMVRDGWRNIYVSPDAWDPAEPDNPDFQDYPDPNEDG